MAEGQKKLPLNFETIGSITAMFIGACALFVAWDQAQVMRAQQHASVWPLISADFTLDQADKAMFVEMTVANKGIGPAQVESVSLTVNGEKTLRWAALERGLFGDNAPKGSMSFGGSDIEGTVIGAGDTVSMFKAFWEINDENMDAFRALAMRYVTGEGAVVDLSVCYCSVFDRCFVAEGGNKPRRVQVCPAPTGFFSGFLAKDQATTQ